MIYANRDCPADEFARFSGGMLCSFVNSTVNNFCASETLMPGPDYTSFSIFFNKSYVIHIKAKYVFLAYAGSEDPGQHMQTDQAFAVWLHKFWAL